MERERLFQRIVFNGEGGLDGRGAWGKKYSTLIRCGMGVKRALLDHSLSSESLPFHLNSSQLGSGSNSYIQ